MNFGMVIGLSRMDHRQEDVLTEECSCTADTHREFQEIGHKGFRRLNQTPNPIRFTEGNEGNEDRAALRFYCDLSRNFKRFVDRERELRRRLLGLTESPPSVPI